MKRRELLRHAALGAISVALYGMLPVRAAAARALPAHPFFGNSFPDVTGAETGLDSYLGKPLVLNFWATWCAPCVKEMPDLELLHKKYPGIQFLGLAVDTTVNVEKFLKKIPVSYPVLIAGHGGIKQMRELGNKQGGLPYTLVFDKHGQIAHEVLGQIKPADLERQLQGLEASR
ncbi:MAG TPA: TlpA disulfide reductase family protein [Candidimonas sp.]|nr:TlpA disulfide reductase family protein [Candidimonas sp.]